MLGTLPPPPMSTPPAIPPCRAEFDTSESALLRAYRTTRRAARSCRGSDSEVQHLCHRYWQAEDSLRALVRRKAGNPPRSRPMAALVDGKLVVVLPDERLVGDLECTIVLDAPQS